ncbi:Molybdate-anion transporter [Rhizophlyctis rosea]|nr:Molybdate-anion transporter [Rhizophlyctis rosea]
MPVNQSLGGAGDPASPIYHFGFGGLVIACALASYYFREGANPSTHNAVNMENGSSLMEDDEKDDDHEKYRPAQSSSNTPFKSFQKNYLLVYCLVMMSDWLQGSYIYPLYRSYGYDLKMIGILFIVGFLSSAIFGTLVGSIADRLGRKRFCVLFCVIYAISCLTKLSGALTVLMIGRVTGGIATSLLFSVFEAWMVSEHLSRGFKENLLSDTFSWSTFLNGLVAISSGVVANFCAEQWGNVAPFMAALLFLAAAGLIVQQSWPENYGSTESGNANKSSLTEAFRTISKSAAIFAVGAMQCCFESAMYTFVFLWSPVLEGVTGVTLPYGIIFSSFMVSIMIGSVVFRVLLRDGWAHVQIARLAFAIAISLGWIDEPQLRRTQDDLLLFVCFNLFELTCGLYFPSIGTIRGRYVPEETRSTVMNVFRVPLNLIVVCALLKVDPTMNSTLFFLCGCLVAIAFLAASRLAKL